MGVMVENRTGPNRLVQARTGLCKLEQARASSNRWRGSWGRIEQSCARTEQGIEQVVAWGRIEHTRKGIEQSCARTEQVVVVMEENRTYPKVTIYI